VKGLSGVPTTGRQEDFFRSYKQHKLKVKKNPWLMNLIKGHERREQKET
jgi:hypothetical protein